MRRWKVGALLITVALAVSGTMPSVQAAATAPEVVDICADLFGTPFGAPNSEPLAACQWNMALINATDTESYPFATGDGVSVGVIDSGIDTNHPDIAPNLDLARS
jgi:subtilisin family serine protease